MGSVQNADLAKNLRYWASQALGAKKLREGLDVVQRVFARWTNGEVFAAFFNWRTNFMAFVTDCGGMEA